MKLGESHGEQQQSTSVDKHFALAAMLANDSGLRIASSAYFRNSGQLGVCVRVIRKGLWL